jgi:PPM family protein phosphatase
MRFNITIAVKIIFLLKHLFIVTTYRLSACTAQHIGDRPEQQDRLALVKHERLKGVALAVVADGMGGRTGGGIAAEQAVTTISQLFERFQVDESPIELLSEAVTQTHSIIKLLSLSEEKEPHSTMVALMTTPDKFYWVHVGDSRLYLFRHGVLKEVTSDHSFVIDAIIAGKLTAEQAAVHPNRNMLTSALGMSSTPRYTLGELDGPQIGDAFLICSDGLWGHFKTNELCHIISTMGPKPASQLLLELARERGRGQGDNISLIVLKLVSADAPMTLMTGV